VVTARDLVCNNAGIGNRRSLRSLRRPEFTLEELQNLLNSILAGLHILVNIKAMNSVRQCNVVNRNVIRPCSIDVNVYY
jgi:hypothetical protein